MVYYNKSGEYAMEKNNKDFQENLSKIWEMTQSQLTSLAKEASILAKKSEAYIRDISGKGKIEAEILIAKAKREKLYYELGKTMACAKKSPGKEKKIEQLQRQIATLNREVNRNEKLLK